MNLEQTIILGYTRLDNELWCNGKETITTQGLIEKVSQYRLWLAKLRDRLAREFI